MVEALGQQLDNKQNPNNQLPENPFTFIPNQNQLADFNALCRQSLALGTSQHFEKMQSYVSHPEKHDWQQIPIQGIADYCAQLSIDDHKTVFLKNFERLSIEIQTAICTSLENHTISPDISNVLINWYQLDKANPQRLHSVLRALGQASDKTKVENFIQVLLQDEKPADHFYTISRSRKNEDAADTRTR